MSSKRFSDDLYYAMGGQLNRLRELMERLYSENRMDADEMRNAAQLLDTFLQDCEQLGKSNSTTEGVKGL